MRRGAQGEGGNLLLQKRGLAGAHPGGRRDEPQPRGDERAVWPHAVGPRPRRPHPQDLGARPRDACAPRPLPHSASPPTSDAPLCTCKEHDCTCTGHVQYDVHGRARLGFQAWERGRRRMKHARQSRRAFNNEKCREADAFPAAFRAKFFDVWCPLRCRQLRAPRGPVFPLCTTETQPA